ncbi:winged helix-turn-helix domain-containing protein [Massilia sp. Dwa41.01b]|uniref:winged helix-turn-helix domain-containing protein n=1 Tax=unclassified Massilia TaxID=2609279 RepID=UPI0016023A50|nr:MULTISPECIES: winged helix-turn-helix domain-containing protein [unclassified Massilia]QNA88627.1 winged helix-turn-helix domain-containing protein [Massilia sp. Dwa41.01b]QNA99517.1 winged helix-turn-helix domain-containing protein [Massilia sp. Se16.2.3]
MSKATRPADVYLRFLNLAQALRALPSLPPLDPLEERILSIVGRAREAQQRLCVRDLMAQAELGAPATIHTRIKGMRKKGWILLADTDDTRRKQVDLTPAALAYFDQLSGCLMQAAKSD